MAEKRWADYLVEEGGGEVPDLRFDPGHDTSTSVELTQQTQDAAIEGWSRVDILPGQSFGPLYRVQDGPWEPTRDEPRGRWAGLGKPTSKSDAHSMYALYWTDPNKLWHLYEFYIEVPAGAPEQAWIFRSRVSGGTGEQVKIPNPTCAYIRIASSQELAT